MMTVVSGDTLGYQMPVIWACKCMVIQSCLSWLLLSPADTTQLPPRMYFATPPPVTKMVFLSTALWEKTPNVVVAMTTSMPC